MRLSILSKGDILSIAFSPDGKSIACGDTSGAVKVYTSAGKLASSVIDPSTTGIKQQNNKTAYCLSRSHADSE